MIPISKKCEQCRYYWNVTCHAIRLLYNAKDEHDLERAQTIIGICKDSSSSCQPPQERKPMGQ
jgi:hypothetical protein